MTIGRVDLFVLRRLAMCRFGLAVVFRNQSFLDTSRFDQDADQLCCGCFWLYDKWETADVLQWCLCHGILLL